MGCLAFNLQYTDKNYQVQTAHIRLRHFYLAPPFRPTLEEVTMMVLGAQVSSMSQKVSSGMSATDYVKSPC